MPALELSPALARLYRNAGILFGGNMASAALNLLCMAILTRALGLGTFGVYALVTAYISLIDRLVSFQTWQALIHYGAHAIEEKSGPRLMRLMKFGWSLDAAAGTAGCIAALTGAMLIPSWFGVDHAGITVVAIASISLIFNWVATPTAILRLYNKFFVQAAFQSVTAGIRLFGMGLLWLSGTHSLLPYIAIWSLSLVMGRLYLFTTGWTMLKANNPGKSGSIALASLRRECPGLIRFILTTNLDGTVRVLRDTDIFLVNAALGPAVTALYKIARELSRVMTQLTGPFYQAVYPELSRLASARDMKGFAHLIRHSALTLGGVLALLWLCFFLIGKFAIILAFGASYAPAYAPALWCLGAMVLWAFSQPLSPALLALRRPQANFVIHLVTSLAYAAAVYMLSARAGLNGAAAAFFGFYAAWSGLMLIALLMEMKKHEAQ